MGLGAQMDDTDEPPFPDSSRSHLQQWRGPKLPAASRHPLEGSSQTSALLASHSTMYLFCFHIKAMVFLSQIFE